MKSRGKNLFNKKQADAIIFDPPAGYSRKVSGEKSLRFSLHLAVFLGIQIT